MANRRMISKGICTSEQVNNLSLESALLFTWLIPHADDDGRIKGSAASVRGNVFPMKEFTVDDIEKMLQEIQEQGLIWRWSDDDGIYIEFPKWLVHQKIRRDRYTPSELPPYKDHVSKMDTNGTPNGNHSDTQDNTVEENKVEENVIEESVGERESEGEPTLDPNAYSPNGVAEYHAKRAWSIFKDTPDVFVSRYLAVARAGVRWSMILAITNEINQDDSIQSKGEEFEIRIKKYLPKNKTSIEKK